MAMNPVGGQLHVAPQNHNVARAHDAQDAGAQGGAGGVGNAPDTIQPAENAAPNCCSRGFTSVKDFVGAIWARITGFPSWCKSWFVSSAPVFNAANNFGGPRPEGAEAMETFLRVAQPREHLVGYFGQLPEEVAPNNVRTLIKEKIVELARAENLIPADMPVEFDWAQALIEGRLEHGITADLANLQLGVPNAQDANARPTSLFYRAVCEVIKDKNPAVVAAKGAADAANQAVAPGAALVVAVADANAAVAAANTPELAQARQAANAANQALAQAQQVANQANQQLAAANAAIAAFAPAQQAAQDAVAAHGQAQQAANADAGLQVLRQAVANAADQAAADAAQAQIDAHPLQVAVAERHQAALQANVRLGAAQVAAQQAQAALAGLQQAAQDAQAAIAPGAQLVVNAAQANQALAPLQGVLDNANQQLAAANAALGVANQELLAAQAAVPAANVVVDLQAALDAANAALAPVRNVANQANAALTAARDGVVIA